MTDPSNAKQDKLDELYLDLADRISQMSVAVRSKVGCVIVKNGNLIAMGWNGMPAGMPNACEDVQDDGSLITKPEVLHSESNALMKLAQSGGIGAKDATLYVTLSPCPECAKLIKQSGISRVVYRHQYRLLDGIDMLKKLDVDVQQR